MARPISTRDRVLWPAAALLLSLPAACTEPRRPGPRRRTPGRRTLSARRRSGPRQDLEAQAEADRRLAELRALRARRPARRGAARDRAGQLPHVRSAPAPLPHATAYGVECRPERGRARPRLAAQRRHGERYPGLVGMRSKSRFAASRNHLPLRHPVQRCPARLRRYPLRDMCRLVSDSRSAAEPATPGLSVAVERSDPRTWGFRDLVETGYLLDLGEAARKGTLDSLRRMIGCPARATERRGRFRHDAAAWAVAYRREDRARVLLQSGARPAGADCSRVDLPFGPCPDRPRARLAAHDRGDAGEDGPAANCPSSTSRRNRARCRPRRARPSSAWWTGTATSWARTHSDRGDGRVDASGISRSGKLGRRPGCRKSTTSCAAGSTATHRWRPARNAFGERVDGEGILTMMIVNPDPR